LNKMRFYLNFLDGHMAQSSGIRPEAFQGTPFWPAVRSLLFSYSRFVVVGFRTNRRFFTDLENSGHLEGL
jgi:hypothetical protein